MLEIGAGTSETPQNPLNARESSRNAGWEENFKPDDVARDES